MRTKARRDSVEADIVRALERCGIVVVRVSSPGSPDLLLYSEGGWLFWRGRSHTYLPAEVKASRGRLTEEQLVTLAKMPFPTLRTVDDALALIGGRV